MCRPSHPLSSVDMMASSVSDERATRARGGGQFESKSNAAPDSRGLGLRASLALDLLVAGVLLAVAYQVRRHGLPTNGLWLDDTTEAAAAKWVSPAGLFTVGGDHPGFIASLMLLRHLGAN